MAKKNCLEFRNCGRQPGGENVGDLGLCAAATTEIMDGVHGGSKGGRACWIVVGTQCGHNAETDAQKRKSACMSCDFFNSVKKEEGANLKRADELFTLIA